MRIVIQCSSLDEGGEIGSDRIGLQTGYKPGEMVGMCSDIADGAAATVLLGIRAPGSLLIALEFDPRRHPLKWILHLHDPNCSEVAALNHRPCLVDHRITAVGICHSEEQSCRLRQVVKSDRVI